MDTDEYRRGIKKEARIVAMEIVKDFMQFVDMKIGAPVAVAKAFEDVGIRKIFNVDESDARDAYFLGAAIALYQKYLKTFPLADVDGVNRFMEKLTIQRVGKRNKRS